MAEKPLTNSINALTAYINEITGESDTNLSDAISTLAEGYMSSDTGEILIAKQEFDSVSRIKIPTSIDWLDEYKTIIVEPNITLSTRDWLYLEGGGYSNQYMQGTTFHQPKVFITKHNDYRWVSFMVKESSIRTNPFIIRSNNTSLLESGYTYHAYASGVTLSGDVSVYGSSFNLNHYLNEIEYILRNRSAV